MQSLIPNVEEAKSSYALARSVSVLDAVNWIRLVVKTIKAETVKKCFAKAGFGESDVADNLEEAGEQDISTKIRTHEQAHHCISEVVQFAIDSNSSSLPELLYTVKGCIKKDMNTK
jgi:hypothetical protein